MKEPVRIKVYGLFRMTKQTYLTITTISYLLLLTAFGMLYFKYHPQIKDPEFLSNRKLMNKEVLITFLENLPWIAAVVVAVALLETFLILRRFKKAEAERDLQSK